MSQNNERRTHRFTRGSDENKDVMSPVICAFLTNVRVLTLASEPDGSVDTAVDCKFSVDSTLNELKVVGKSPAVQGNETGYEAKRYL